MRKPYISSSEPQRSNRKSKVAFNGNKLLSSNGSIPGSPRVNGERIHADYPENLECLRYLVAICKDLGHKYDHYQASLAKLEGSCCKNWWRTCKGYSYSSRGRPTSS